MTTLFAGILIGLSGCGDSAFKNYLDQERARQRETSASLAADYQQLTGSWRNIENDGAPWSIRTEFHSVPSLPSQSGSATYVPQTILHGSMELTPRADLAGKMKEKDVIPGKGTLGEDLDAADPGPITYRFKDGVYDAATGQFAARIVSSNGDSIDISCHYGQAGRMACVWLPGFRAKEFHFELARE